MNSLKPQFKHTFCPASPSPIFYFIFFFIWSGLNVWENWHKSSAATEWRRRRKRLGSSGGRSYLRLHGSVHGRCVGRRAAVGERFRGAGRQRGLLGRRGGLRGALNVLTVALVGLRWRNCRGCGGKRDEYQGKIDLVVSWETFTFNQQRSATYSWWQRY